jgi:hypothetical protein
MSARRFPPPWFAEPIPGGYVVKASPRLCVSAE